MTKNPEWSDSSARPACPKCCQKRPMLIVHGEPAEDWTRPAEPYEHLGCLPAPDGARYECTHCHHRWNPGPKS